MDPKEQKDRFQWTCKLERTAFPLDWSFNQWCDQYELNRLTAGKYLIQNPFFADFFNHTRYYNGSTTKRISHVQYDGVPVELEEFFAEYVRCAMQYVKKSRNAGAMLRSPEGDRDFDQRFCEHCLHQAETADEEHSVVLQRLYANKAFQETAMKELWGELHDRYETFENLMHRCAPLEQIAYIKHVLAFCDMQIASLSGSPSRNTVQLEEPQTTQMPFLDTFPWEVIEYYRQPIHKEHPARDEFMQYNLPNLTVTEDQNGKSLRMHQVFNQICMTATGQYKPFQEAQEQYRRYLQKQTEKTEFQKQYESIKSYFSRRWKEVPPSILKRDIQEITEKYFSYIKSGMRIPSNLGESDRNQSEYLRCLHDLISQFTWSFVNQFEWAIVFVGVKDFHIEILQMAYMCFLGIGSKNPDSRVDLYDSQVVVDFTQHFLRGIEFIWPEQILGRKQAFDYDLIRGQSAVNGKLLYEKCKQVLSGEEGYVWLEEIKIENAFATYENLLRGKCSVEQCQSWLVYYKIFFSAIMALRIQQESENIQKKVYNYYTFMINITEH